MFGRTPEDIVDILKNEDVTVNAHQFCIVDDVSSAKLNFRFIDSSFYD